MTPTDTANHPLPEARPGDIHSTIDKHPIVNGHPPPNRRMLLKGAGLAALAGLAACASPLRPGLSIGGGGDPPPSPAGTLAGIRAKASLAPLVVDPQLERAALQQANYMASCGCMTHTTGP